MKKQLILAVTLFLTVSLTFAQKKELKKLQKAVKSNNFSEAKAMVSQLEPMLGAMDEKTKSKYYFATAKTFYANGAADTSDLQKTLDNLKQVNEKHVSADFPKTKQTIQNELLTKANTLYTSKNYNEASTLFEMLYQLIPSDQAYLYYAAASATAAKDYDVALKYYLNLKELDYTGVETQFYATNIETGKEDVLVEETRDLYVNKLKTHIKPGKRETESKKTEITKNIALIYTSQGKDDKALAAIAEARALDPDDSSLIITEANTHYKLGNITKYEKLINEAIEKDPNNKDLLYNLGVLSAQSGKNEKAKEYYKKALAIDPNYINALTNMASVVLSDEKQIIEEMNGLGSSKKDNDRYDELKLKRLSLYKIAIPYLEKSITLDNKNTDAIKTLMNLFGAIGEGEKVKALKTKFGL